MARLVLGLVGVALAIGGVFAPLVRFHFGDVTSYGAGHGDGVFIIALAVMAIPLLFAKSRWPVLFAALPLAALEIVSFFDLRARMPSDPLAWGWVPLALGALCLLAAGLLPRKS